MFVVIASTVMLHRLSVVVISEPAGNMFNVDKNFDLIKTDTRICSNLLLFFKK